MEMKFRLYLRNVIDIFISFVIAQRSFIYTDATKGSVNDTTNLISKKIKPGEVKCLSFWYYSFGNPVDNLIVYQDYETLWNSRRNTSNKIYVQIDLLQTEREYEIFFEAQRKLGSKRFIALGDIVLTDEACKAEHIHEVTCINVKDSPGIQHCVNSKIKLEQSSLVFYPQYENCTEVYNKAHLQTCDNSKVCIKSNVLQKNPECFMLNKLKIEYKCQALTSFGKESQPKNGNSNSAVVGSVIAGVILLASLVVLIVVFRRSKRYKQVNRNLQGKDIIALTSPSQDDYSGNQSISIPDKHITQKAVGKVQNRSGGESSTDGNQHEYTYVDVENTKEQEGESVGAKKNDLNSENTRDAYTILNPNETGFDRSKIKTKMSNKKINDLVFGTDDNNDITYDTSNTIPDKEIDTNIYSHTIDNVYDVSSQKQEFKDSEDIYDRCEESRMANDKTYD